MLPQNLFVFLIVLNYLLNCISNRFYETRKIIQLFSVFTVFSHKKKSIVNLYQKELLGCFSEDIKTWPSHNVLNWYTSNWLLFDIYVDSMGLNTNVNTLIF